MDCKEEKLVYDPSEQLMRFFKKGDVSFENKNGILYYRKSKTDKEKVEVISSGNIISINVFFNDTKIPICCRYTCNSDKEIIFLLKNGRASGFFIN